MKEIKVRSEQGELLLQKSQKLVGLKTKTDAKTDEIAAQVIPNLGGFEVVTLQDKEDIDTALDQVRTDDKVEVGTHVYFAKGDNRPVVPTGILYINFVDEAGEEEWQVALDAYALETMDIRPGNLVIARVTAGSPNPLKTAAALEALSLVESVVPDLDIPLDQYFTAPRDGLYTHQWHLENDGRIDDANFPTKPGADAKVTAAWRRLGNLGSRNIKIAVIDNGFDLNHPDLRGKSISQFDALANRAGVPRGQRYGNHATPCASVALASANGSGIVGVAPNSKLIPIHGLSYSRWTTELMFNHCIRNGADIISCSWGTIQSAYRPSNLHLAAIRKAARQGRGGKGCVILFAAGNENANLLNYYATIPEVICVGASTSNDTHAFYSNRGPQLSVVAPSDGGWPILAARASWDTGAGGKNSFYVDGRDRGPFYKHFGGTSSATPLVAGVCALILSANPNLTAAQVKQILQRTADKIGSPREYDSRGHSVKYGFGRVNADRAVAEAIRLRSGGTTFPTTPSQPSQPTTPTTPTRPTQPTTPTQPTQPTEPTTPTNPPPTPTTPTAGVDPGLGIFRFSVQRQAATGFGLQIGVYRDYATVLREVEKLERVFKLPVIVSINKVNGALAYKVVLGAFNTANEARNQIGRAKLAGYAPFIRNIKDLA